MSTLFAVKLEPDHELEVLFAAPPEAGPTPYGVEDDIIRKGAATLSGAMEMVRAVGQCAIDKLRGLDIESGEVSVGLKLSATGKFVVAEATAAASLNVKFKLRTAPSSPAGGS